MTRVFLFGTAIIVVINIDITTKIMFTMFFGGDRRATLATSGKPSKMKISLMSLVAGTFASDNGLDFIKKFLGNNRVMDTFEEFALVFQNSVIERIGQYPLNGIEMNLIPLFNSKDGVLKEKISNLDESKTASSKQLERFSNVGGFMAVNDNRFGLIERVII